MMVYFEDVELLLDRSSRKDTRTGVSVGWDAAVKGQQSKD